MFDLLKFLFVNKETFPLLFFPAVYPTEKLELQQNPMKYNPRKTWTFLVAYLNCSHFSFSLHRVASFKMWRVQNKRRKDDIDYFRSLWTFKFVFCQLKLFHHSLAIAEWNGLVAKWTIASDFESEGCRFESCRGRYFFWLQLNRIYFEINFHA